MKLNLQLALVAFCGLLAVPQAQAQSSFVNEGVIIGRPEIAADTFVNLGYFEIETTTNAFNDPTFNQIGFTVEMPPYSPLGTTEFRNETSGRMIGDFRFATKVEDTFVPAESFTNLGLIESFNHLLISADNVDNHGIMDAGSASRLEIRGQNVDLTFGKLNASLQSDFSFGGGNISNTNYANPIGVDDVYWGVGTNQVIAQDANNNGRVFDHSNYLIPTNFLTSPHDVVDAANLITNIAILPNPLFAPAFSAADYDVSVNTNAIDGTNAVIQMTFFRTNFPPAIDTNTFFASETRWIPGGDYSSPVVNYQYNSFNNFIDGFATQDLFIVDSFPILSPTNRFLMNNITINTQFRPNSYEVIRDRTTIQGAWDAAAPGNTTFTNTLLVNPTLVDTVVSNSFYAAYSFELFSPEPTDFIFVNGIAIPTNRPTANLRHPTNLVGRMIIEADTLDLSDSLIRAENYLKIQANNLVGTPPSSIDSQRFDLSLSSSADGGAFLNVTNMIADSVARFSGEVGLYTTMWTNQYSILTTNVDDAGTETITTNFADNIYHIFVVDPIFETDTQSEIMNLSLKNDNRIVIGDNFRLSESVVVDSAQVDIFSRIIGDSTVPPVTDSVFPSVSDFNNFGTLSFVDSFSLGTTRTIENITMAAGASLSASTINIKADNISAAGASSISSTFGSILMESQTLSLTDGTILSPSGRTVLNANEINLGGLVFDSLTPLLADFPNVTGPLEIHAGSMLHDDGIGATISTSGGIQIIGSGLSGDLGFSTISSTVPKFKQSIHTWPGEDRGAGVDAFNNNLAVGTFIFDVLGSPTRVVINGSTPGNHALYIKNLVLSGDAETNFDSVFSIADNVKIYFQELTSANSLLLVEDVNGAYGGKFVHVPVVTEEQNGNDSDLGLTITTTTGSDGGSSSITLSIDAQPGIVYSIQKTSDLGSGVWVPVGQITNPTGSTTRVSSAVLSTEGSQGFFRIVAE